MHQSFQVKLENENFNQECSICFLRYACELSKLVLAANLSCAPAHCVNYTLLAVERSMSISPSDE